VVAVVAGADEVSVAGLVITVEIFVAGLVVTNFVEFVPVPAAVPPLVGIRLIIWFTPFLTALSTFVDTPWPFNSQSTALVFEAQTPDGA
jgi:hypothetical protein